MRLALLIGKLALFISIFQVDLFGVITPPLRKPAIGGDINEIVCLTVQLLNL
ncbi:hypothetical protein GCM10023352_20600 [Rothia endophytica]|uniref:Uncharacterized protein n=1 Tax=Rothia endophytica TaxID=1324766 RepID=A0ABP9BXN3_9MICC